MMLKLTSLMMSMMMIKSEHWIKVFDASIGHHEMLDDFSEVLRDMGIEAFNDDERAEKEGVDLFIVLEKQEKK